MKSTRGWIAMGLLLLFTTVIALLSIRYFSLEKIAILTFKSDDLFGNPLYKIGFYGHISFGMLALLIGPYQFMPKLRARNISLHRTIGKLYVVFCLISGLCGLGIAQFATGGWIARLGFTGLALAWLITTSMAYLKVKKGDIDSHRDWMFRSYAVTMAAVTLRLYLGPMELFGMDFITAYRIVAWACWVPNLVLVEMIWINRSPAATTS